MVAEKWGVMSDGGRDMDREAGIHEDHQKENIDR
jgi:hypothetical protein